MRWLLLLLLASPAVAEELPFTVSTLGSGSGPEAAQLADLDGDGDLDVAVVGDTIRWLENLGTSFTSHDIDASYSGGTGLVVGDVDRDGDVDIITTNPAADTIDQALNNGDGTFVLSTIDATQPDPARRTCST
jgi:hypothetical protein